MLSHEMLFPTKCQTSFWQSTFYIQVVLLVLCSILVISTGVMLIQFLIIWIRTSNHQVEEAAEAAELTQLKVPDPEVATNDPVVKEYQALHKYTPQQADELELFKDRLAKAGFS